MEHAARYVRMRMRGLKQDASSHQSNSSFFALKKIEEYSTYLKKMSHIYLLKSEVRSYVSSARAQRALAREHRRNKQDTRRASTIGLAYWQATVGALFTVTINSGLGGTRVYEPLARRSILFIGNHTLQNGFQK